MVKRAYSSEVREAQVEQTRERLLETAREMLVSDGIAGLTLPRLAKAASVSAPTVYRYFATLDDLLRALLEWIRPQLGQTRDRLLQGPPEQIAALPGENFPRFETHAPLLTALMDSPLFNKVRHASIGKRRELAAALLREAAPGWRRRDLEAAAGAIYVLSAPQTWRWLRETWEIDTRDAARAATWAIGTLIKALGTGRGLGKRRETDSQRKQP